MFPPSRMGPHPIEPLQASQATFSFQIYFVLLCAIVDNFSKKTFPLSGPRLRIRSSLRYNLFRFSPWRFSSFIKRAQNRVVFLTIFEDGPNAYPCAHPLFYHPKFLFSQILNFFYPSPRRIIDVVRQIGTLIFFSQGCRQRS